MFTKWSPFADRLSRDTGFDLRLKVYETMLAFEKDCAKGTPDFMYSSPPQTVLARAAQGYEPLLRNSAPVAAIVFVKKDSPIRTIEELGGREIAFVGSRNVCSILIRQQLRDRDLPVNVTNRFTGSTRNVYEHVLHGSSVAGGTLDTVFSKEMADKVRVIFSSPPIASHPLSAHPRVPAIVRAAVVRAIFAMRKSSDGKAVLETIGFSSPLSADYDRDYRFFESLDLVGLSREE
jgi:phosphonate transport system substrate-binding protein